MADPIQRQLDLRDAVPAIRARTRIAGGASLAAGEHGASRRLPIQAGCMVTATGMAIGNEVQYGNAGAVQARDKVLDVF